MEHRELHIRTSGRDLPEDSLTIVATFNLLIKVWIVSEVGLLLFTHTRKNGGALRDRGSLLLLWPAIWLAIVAGGWYSGRHPHTMFHGAHWLFAVALVLLIAGLILRWTAILTLGRAFSVNVAIRAGQTVKQDGVYRLVRHPSYTGMLLCILGVAVSTRNWIGLLIIIAPITAALLYRIHVEEAALSGAFGDAYGIYAAKTRRLIPGIF